MRKLLYLMAFILPFITFTSCITDLFEDEDSSSNSLNDTEWEGSIYLEGEKIGMLRLQFHETTLTMIGEVDYNGDGEITDDEIDITRGNYTVDDDYVYIEIEGVTEKGELSGGYIYMTVTDTDFAGMPVEIVFEQII